MVRIVAAVMTLAAVVALALMAAPATGQEGWSDDRPDAHAPLGLGPAHLLEAGALTVGYQYSYERWSRLYQGTDRVDPEDAFALGYARVPSARNVHRHVAELMYAPDPRVTLLAELPFVHGNLTIERPTAPATDQSISGIGDVRVGALVRLLDRDARRLLAGLVLNLPTGATDETDGAGSLPYMAQPGSGTFDIQPSVTFADQHPLWSWGAQVGGALRLGESPEEFRLGNRLDTSVWASYRVMRWASASLRLAGAFWGDVRDDVEQFPASPMAEPGLTGGTRIELLAGANLHAAAGIFQGHHLFGELGFPVYQDLDGPQLGLSWRALVGWRWAVGQP